MKVLNVLCFINEKGGVGKTTSAGNVASALTRLGKRVLLIDADPAARLTTWTQTANGATLADVWTGKKTAAEVIRRTAFGDVLPGGREMALELVGADFNIFRLREIILPLKGIYDYVVIDTAPSLSLLNAAALYASTDVLIVTKPEKFSIDGIGEFYLKGVIVTVRLQLLDTVSLMRNICIVLHHGIEELFLLFSSKGRCL